jgi:hypothetical protein
MNIKRGEVEVEKDISRENNTRWRTNQSAPTPRE